MAFTIPNEVDAGFSDQAELHSRDIDILVLGFGLTGVLSGGAVTAQGSPDNTVAVASGIGLSNGAYVTWTTGNLTMTAADGTNPRFDLISVSNAGTKTYTAGTAGTNPTPPAVPSNNIPLAVIYVPVSDNINNTNQLTDKRVMLREKGSPYVLVAASDAPATTKAIADYVCDGVDDRANFTSAVSTGGKCVVLSEGTFVFSGVWSDNLKNNTTIVGAGMGLTTIKLGNSANSQLIANTNSNVISGVSMLHLTLDGNKVNQTDGATRDARSIMQLVSISGLMFHRLETKNGRSGASIRMYNCSRIYESGCYFHDNGLRAATSGSHTLPQGTITVDDTTGFASAGKISIGGSQNVSYTGKTGTTFTGATGGTGTFVAGTYVYPVTNDANNFLLISDATFHGSSSSLRVIGNHYENNTDTGTAMDGVVRAVVAENMYINNALGVGVGFSNAETGGSADSCESIQIGSNVIYGLNQANHECQGIKVGSFGNTGDGANNRRITMHHNVIYQCDRSLWLDTIDDSEVGDNLLIDAAGPNKQLILLAPSGTTLNRIGIINNKFKNTTNRGISFDVGTITGVEVSFNTFDTDVTTPIGGTIPSDTRMFGNKGVGETDPQVTALNFVVDGGGAAITTGVKGYVMVPYNCTVTAWRLTADQSGSIVFDVWKDTYANYPPTVADTIAGSEKPTLSSVTKNEDVSLTTWTTTLNAGDWLGFNVDSATTVQRVTLVLLLKRIG